MIFSSSLPHTREGSHSRFYRDHSLQRQTYQSLPLPSSIKRSYRHLSTHCLQLDPGLILIKSNLSINEQKELANEALKNRGENAKGFWKTDSTGKRILNSTHWRGRIYDSIDKFPPLVSEICQRTIHLANEQDKTLFPVVPTHLINLYYKSNPKPHPNVFIPWHQDNGENDGDGFYPVISFTVGDSCEFLISHLKPRISANNPLSNPANLAHRILFESGDVLIFGGACRNIWHSIYKILPNTAPPELPTKEIRLNWTSRYSPMIEDVEKFATQEADSLPKDNQFYKLTKMK